MNIISEKVIRSIVKVEGYITANSLAELTGFSASNIKHNLYQIKEEIEKFDVTLQSVPKKGLCLIATPEQRNEIVQALNEEVSKNAEFYTFRKEYILETLFLFKANYTIQLFADELVVSKNTIQKDLKHIDQELNKFHVKIKCVRNQGIILVGNEFNIRQAMIECNNKKYWNWNRDIITESTGEMDRRISKKAYTYFSGTYSMKNLLKVQEQLLHCEQELGLQFIDVSFGRLLEYLTITIERVQIGKQIEKNVEEETAGIDIKYLNAAIEILYNLLPENKKGYFAEAQYLAARLFVASVCNNTYVEDGDEFKEIAIDFLLGLEGIICTKVLSVNEELINELSIAFHRIKIREIYQILDWSELYKDIQKQLTGLYGICMAQLHDVETRIGCRFKRDDVAWIVLLIYNCIRDVSNRIPAILVHGTNHHIALYQKRKIEEEIPKIKIKDIIYFKQYDRGTAKDHLVISSVPFKGEADNLIEITKHLKKEDMECIQNGIEDVEWRYQSSVLINVIQNVFSEKLIIPNLRAYTMKEAIVKMTEVLKKEGYVKEGYCQKVLEREDFCPTSIGNEIAIPHHYREYIIENGIAVAKVKHGLTWKNEEKVKLIFLMAIKYKEPLKVKMIFHYMYELIENQELLGKIKEAETSSQLFDYIMASVKQ